MINWVGSEGGPAVLLTTPENPMCGIPGEVGDAKNVPSFNSLKPRTTVYIAINHVMVLTDVPC